MIDQGFALQPAGTFMARLRHLARSIAGRDDASRSRWFARIRRRSSASRLPIRHLSQAACQGARQAPQVSGFGTWDATIRNVPLFRCSLPEGWIPPVPLPAGYQGTAYPATTWLATGGSGTGYAWNWAAASGSSLPAGLTLSAGGVIPGTPTAACTFNVVITVTDSAGNTATTSPSLIVEARLAIRP